MKKIILLLIGFCSFACNSTREDVVQEDYDVLFPFRGIDQPDISYDDMRNRHCDPEQPLHQYKYMGVQLENKREYTVTLKCKLKDGENDSRYVIRYIGEDKNIHTIGTDPNSNGHSFILEADKEKIISFNVHSGYPMYLSVDGVGSRGSGIIASIRASSTDGYINTPIISTEQYQNNEGPNRIPNPFCQYIILP